MQGNKTHEQFERVIHKDEKTKGLQDVGPAQPLKVDVPDTPEYDLSTGDRSIKRGEHQETQHTKAQQKH